jgi:histidyl-tRNA synthetase
VVNPRLVRGLDYYCHSVFEWVTTSLGAQGTVCAGGRYDGLVEQLGGKPTSAAGFAMGIERLVAMLEDQDKVVAAPDSDVYLVMVGENTLKVGQKLAQSLRDAYPSLRLVTHAGGGSFKSQMKKADKSGARIALILGEQELQDATINIKYLRDDVQQQPIAQSELVDRLGRIID